MDYSFDDNDPYDGTSYYRIKQTDFDGKYKYSDIKAVNSKIEKLKLVPNPADAETNVNFGLRRAQDVTIKIIDITGLSVFEKTFSGTKGINEIPVDISNFGKGIYNVILIANGEVSTEKLSVF